MAPIVPKKRGDAPRKETWEQRKQRAASEQIELYDDIKAGVRKLLDNVAKEVERRRRGRDNRQS